MTNSIYQQDVLPPWRARFFYNDKKDDNMPIQIGVYLQSPPLPPNPMGYRLMSFTEGGGRGIKRAKKVKWLEQRWNSCLCLERRYQSTAERGTIDKSFLTSKWRNTVMRNKALGLKTLTTPTRHPILHWSHEGSYLTYKPGEETCKPHGGRAGRVWIQPVPFTRRPKFGWDRKYTFQIDYSHFSWDGPTSYW